MSERPRSPLEAELLALPSGERARLAHLLIVSLDDEHEDDGDLAAVERAWDEEIQRRLDDLRSGRAEALPASEVFERARRHLR